MIIECYPRKQTVCLPLYLGIQHHICQNGALKLDILYITSATTEVQMIANQN